MYKQWYSSDIPCINNGIVQIPCTNNGIVQIPCTNNGIVQIPCTKEDFLLFSSPSFGFLYRIYTTCNVGCNRNDTVIIPRNNNNFVDSINRKFNSLCFFRLGFWKFLSRIKTPFRFLLIFK